MVLAKEKYGLRGRESPSTRREFIAFTAQTRMSGVNLDGRESVRAPRNPSNSSS